MAFDRKAYDREYKRRPEVIAKRKHMKHDLR